jgi:predicted TIM-barrel fold metal-dependent hydrolase
MIVDSHCHAWAKWPYEPSVPDPDTRGRVEHLLYEMDQNEVSRAIVICANINGVKDNNEYVAGEADKHPDRLHVFPDIDSSWSDTYHMPGAATRLQNAVDRWDIRGFTHYLKAGPDGWLTSRDGMQFFEVAQRHRLIASFSANQRWQPELRKLAERFPGLPILLHHRGSVRNTAPAGEMAGLLDLAELPNIFLKASGFYYGVKEEWNFPYRESIESFQRIYEVFGPKRLCWGSDFPVCLKGRSTYRQALEVVRSHCAFIPQDDMEWVLGRTLEGLLTLPA